MDKAEIANEKIIPLTEAEQIVQLTNENKLLQLKLAELFEKYSLLIYKRFGRSTEAYEGENQLSLFTENVANTETSEEQLEGDTKTEIITSYTRKKQGRKPLDDKLPRKEIIIDIPEEDKKCACGTDLVRIGEEVSERLQVIPMQIYVERIIRPKYACKNCEGSGDEDKCAVRIADAPITLIPGSIATPGLLAFIMINKYADHLPFYRQEKRFEREGIRISRQNMSNWQQNIYYALDPLLKLLKEHLRTGIVLRMDETPVQVMKEEGKEDTQLSYMWLARGGPQDKPVLIYEYQRSRASEHIHSFLEGFSGFLQTDGYPGYVSALKTHPHIIHVGCFAHVRREFFDAAKADTKKSKSAEEALKHIQQLYRIENELRAKKLSDADFLIERKKLCEPVLEKFKAWLLKREPNVPPSLLLGKAIRYALNQWNNCVAYLESAELTPDNNKSENAIRPFVLGRKNWLFSGSPEGAKSSCAMYSLIETAKVNNLNPETYLKTLFEKAPLARKKQDWEALLPWNFPKN